MSRPSSNLADSPQLLHNAEMDAFQKGSADPFFDLKMIRSRPQSEVTDLYDTDFDDMEDDYESAPELEARESRLSIKSEDRLSSTTLSSFEEIQTPQDAEAVHFRALNSDRQMQKPVEGPTGPHLFRSSVDSSLSAHENEYVLGMSPMTPKATDIQITAHDAPAVPRIPVRHRPTSKLAEAGDEFNLEEVASWTPRQVARWMQKAGIERHIYEKFLENDISGAILITLKFEDLRELDIPSFGVRTKVWNEVHVLRGSAPSTPAAETPIEDAAYYRRASRKSPDRQRSVSKDKHAPSRASSRDKHAPSRSLSRDKHAPSRSSSKDRHAPSRSASKDKHGPSRSRSSRRRKADIKYTEPVSIVGIEQLMPKPHHCSKGENCSKFKKQQRLIEAFMNEHPGCVDGMVIESTDSTRPFSDMTTSVIASSDVLGPQQTPPVKTLEEGNLQTVQSRDPQDNVKQFLKFQFPESRQVWEAEERSEPPYEMFPPLRKSARLGPNGLPKLSIPNAPPRAASANAMSPSRRARDSTLDLRNMANSPQARPRFGTPFSEMDVPVTQVPLGPVARDHSQSVPPNMTYHQPAPPTDPPARTQSRTSYRRPSIHLPMPPLHENMPMRAQPRPATVSPIDSISATPTQHYPPSAPWSPPRRDRERDSVSRTPSKLYAPPNPWTAHRPQRSNDDTAMSGWMKKRKNRLLRHEWQERYFSLKGTRLAMHSDAQSLSALEYIDIDDYAVACSSIAGGNKLNAAFKAMNISRGNKGLKEEAAFAFQLVPALQDKGEKDRVGRLRQLLGEDDCADGKGKGKLKPHYFAVKSRDERIDWMRELMLAKALRQKTLGYEVNVNGNAI